MGKIHLLDSSTINKIAAGEVIERPASVVKELVENSLDAESKEITIKLRDGGKKEITVIDDGQGMPEDDLNLSILRHATSKISNIEDIYSIYSYGFRGEALATIADVSKLEITSATSDMEHSNTIVVENGQILKKTQAAHKRGTSISVQNLFYNVPARQKFLKTSNYELRKIIEWIKTIAISNPTVDFKVFVEGKEIYHFFKKQGYEERINEVNFDIAKELVSGTYKDAIISAIAFVTRPNRVSEHGTTQIYVNNRPIKNFSVISAIKKAFEAKIPRTHKPSAFIFLEINPKVFDVNVHPQKLEIRVREDSMLFLPVYYAVKNALEQIKEVEIDRTRPTQLISNINQELENSEVIFEKKEFVTNTAQKSLPFVKEINYTPTHKDFRIIGQLFNTYILIEKNNSLFIVDQHVAEERYNFENIQKQYDKEAGLLKQEMLVPFNFPFSFEDRKIILENKEILEKLGLEIDEINDGIIVRSVPLKIKDFVNKEEIKELLKELANDLKADLKEKQTGLFATIACKASVKAGAPLTELQMEKIIINLFSCENPYTCPHGRPIFIELSKDKIEKEVHRK